MVRLKDIIYSISLNTFTAENAEEKLENWNDGMLEY